MAIFLESGSMLSRCGASYLAQPDPITTVGELRQDLELGEHTRFSPMILLSSHVGPSDAHTHALVVLVQQIIRADSLSNSVQSAHCSDMSLTLTSLAMKERSYDMPIVCGELSIAFLD
jgi:hypothetical protein